MAYIKVNLPEDEKSFISGNGEGCFAIVSDEVKAAWDADVTGGVYEGILDNDSIYYPSLKHGVIIKFEMRGINRPVAFLKELSI